MDEMIVLNGGLRMSNSDTFHTRMGARNAGVGQPGRGFNIKGFAIRAIATLRSRASILYAMANPDLGPEA